MRRDFPKLHYTFAKKDVDGLAQYNDWVRWVRNRVTCVRPGSSLYPLYTGDYQTLLKGYILEDYSALLSFKYQMKNGSMDNYEYESPTFVASEFGCFSVVFYIEGSILRIQSTNVRSPIFSSCACEIFPTTTICDRHFASQR